MSEPNIPALLEAIQDARPWMRRFTKKTYPQAFQDYTVQFGGLFREALRDAGEADFTALADTLLDGLAESWSRQRFWNRASVQMNDKQMLVCFLSPMLLEDPDCARAGRPAGPRSPIRPPRPSSSRRVSGPPSWELPCRWTPRRMRNKKWEKTKK